MCAPPVVGRLYYIYTAPELYDVQYGTVRFHHTLQEKEQEEEDEGEDTFELEITIGNPEKVGDGMSSYMTYSVKTKTTMPDFKNPESTVRRRFSDFLGLHHRLSEKYTQKGRIVPPAPEKSMMGKWVREGNGDLS